MKIAILNQWFQQDPIARNLGGAEIATYNTAKHLCRRGHQVHVISHRGKGSPEQSTEEGFYIHRIKARRVRFLETISFCLKALPVLRKINPEVVHAQGTTIGICGFLAKRFLKKPYVVYCRGADVYSSWLLKKPISKLVLENADAVIALTEDMKGELQKLCNKEIIVIPNGVDSGRFENLPREETRRRLQIKDEERIIIFVGSLRPVKGVEYLVEAMNIIRQKSTKTRLVIVGDGEERENLERLVGRLDLGEFVAFAGEIPNEKVAHYMAASDVFALPSLREGFPNVLLEAMASGLPIVATKVGGMPEVIEDGNNGFLVEPENSEQIAERVLLLLEDKELRERISVNNKEKARGYSWESVAERLEVVYQGIHGG